MLGLFIRTKFNCTSRLKADESIRAESERTLELAKALEPSLAGRSITVPKMIGVDEDMRDWSIFQTLEHNVIVNHSITQLVVTLANEQQVITNFDPKTDVMPAAEPDTEQLNAFEASVEQHFSQVSALKRLRSRQKYRHPLFGNFSAHQWHCMFGFHLMLHRRQLQKAVELLQA